MQHALRIEDYSVKVRLGCQAEERAVPQEVRLTLEYRFLTAPAALHSDRLEDTICYGEVCSSLRKHCESKEFHLIERLAGECFEIAKGFARGRAELALRVHKVSPPVENLRGGSVYELGDFRL
jgi:dihydroneopterin aldolase